MRIRLRRAEGSELGYVESLLAENGLPTDDLRSGAARFYVGYDGGGSDRDSGDPDGDSGDPVCVGGLEGYGSVGLLRSVAVEESARGDGVGTALCEALADEARDEGIESLYLLTMTASAFFGSLGYVEIERTEVPRAIRETAQFADLCPVSATCMRKTLVSDPSGHR